MSDQPYEVRTHHHRDRTVTFSLYHDPHMGPPWKEHDGHGPVSEWTTRDKGSGERILKKDGRSCRYYDFREAVNIARKDGWGLGPKELAALEKKLGRTPKPGDIAVAAAVWCGIYSPKSLYFFFLATKYAQTMLKELGVILCAYLSFLLVKESR